MPDAGHLEPQLRPIHYEDGTVGEGIRRVSPTNAGPSPEVIREASHRVGGSLRGMVETLNDPTLGGSHGFSYSETDLLVASDDAGGDVRERWVRREDGSVSKGWVTGE